jgi:SPP1 gp7 family putative phage head morphogenesis protein
MAKYEEYGFWQWVRRAERRYAQWLRGIAGHVSSIVRAFEPGDPAVLPDLNYTLNKYADGIEPWARAVSARMVQEVAGRDATAWFRASRDIGKSLRREINEAPIGHVAQQIVNDQVGLIGSIPRQEAERVQRLTMEGVSDGKRYSEIVPEILRTNDITRNRAILIARTETAKAQSAIVQARSLYVGAPQYTWRTVGDADVREAHRKLEGRVCSWDDPPVAEANGARHAPGEYPNCRPSCWAEPLILPP